MYMTRLELDPLKRATQKALAAPAMLHGAVEAGFSGLRRRRLWRVDELNGRCYLLIVSLDMPELASAAAQFAPEGATWETRSYDEFLSNITSGSRWRFRLAANPTVSHVEQNNTRGKVYAHVTVQQQKQWLMDRSEKHGFRLKEDDFDVTRRGVLSFAKGPRRQHVTLGYCVFDGTLEVADAVLLRQTLTDGLGRGKAYGLGMLTLARIKGERQ
ncbi:MAG: type I-E CRISPR-associated protein Cas6/Cse3/CasE [bacterium]